MPDRKFQQDREPVIRPILILTGTADGHMLPAITPVRRHTFQKPIDPLRYDMEGKVSSLPDHISSDYTSHHFSAGLILIIVKLDRDKEPL